MTHKIRTLLFLACFSCSGTMAKVKRPLGAEKSPMKPDDLEKSFNEAKEYLEKNKKTFPNQNFLVVIQYGQASNVKRFHLFDLKSNNQTAYLVAHGKGSDPDFTGFAKSFSDVPGSRMTPLGFFRSTETYFGQHGYSLKLEGLSDSNKNSMSRSIVIHGAKYVSDQRKILGRSWGCPALDPKVTEEVINKIKNGALIYSVF